MELTVGAILEGKVKSITNFGAFISLPEGKTGMVHISEVANAYVSDIRQHLTEGQDVKVMVIGLENGKVNLSIKRLEPKPQRENGGNRNGNYRGAPRQDGGYRRENSAPAQNRPQRAPMQPAAPKTADRKITFPLRFCSNGFTSSFSPFFPTMIPRYCNPFFRRCK